MTNNNYTHVLKKFTGSQNTSFSLGTIYHNMFIKLLMEIQSISVLLANESSHLDLQSLPSRHLFFFFKSMQFLLKVSKFCRHNFFVCFFLGSLAVK